MPGQWPDVTKIEFRDEPVRIRLETLDAGQCGGIRFANEPFPGPVPGHGVEIKGDVFGTRLFCMFGRVFPKPP